MVVKACPLLTSVRVLADVQQPDEFLSRLSSTSRVHRGEGGTSLLTQIEIDNAYSFQTLAARHLARLGSDFPELENFHVKGVRLYVGRAKRAPSPQPAATPPPNPPNPPTHPPTHPPNPTSAERLFASPSWWYSSYTYLGWHTRARNPCSRYHDYGMAGLTTSLARTAPFAPLARLHALKIGDLYVGWWWGGGYGGRREGGGAA